jgi:hypothetical protein
VKQPIAETNLDSRPAPDFESPRSGMEHFRTDPAEDRSLVNTCKLDAGSHNVADDASQAIREIVFCTRALSFPPPLSGSSTIQGRHTLMLKPKNPASKPTIPTSFTLYLLSWGLFYANQCTFFDSLRSILCSTNWTVGSPPIKRLSSRKTAWISP